MFFSKKSKMKIPKELDYINETLGVHKASHIVYGAYYHAETGNFGDRIIPKLGIDLLNHHVPQPIYSKLGLARNKALPDKPLFLKEELSCLQGLVIGPGGLITGKHKTKSLTNKLFLNFNSEDAQVLADNGIPLFFWTTGVNFWSSKNPFTDEIKNELSKILERTTFAFLRGQRDIEFIKSFAPESLHSKLIFQPCASLFLSELRGVKHRPSLSGKKRVAVNIAVDHLQEFFSPKLNSADAWKKNKKKYIKDFAEYFKKNLNLLKELGFDPIMFCNTTGDTEFVMEYFSKYKRLDTHKISSAIIKPEELVSHFDLCIGMRLHSWLPFLSLGIPSLFITPFEVRAGMPKDLGLEELSFKYNVETKEELAQKIKNIVDQSTQVKGQIYKSKQAMGKLTKENANKLYSNLKHV